MVLLLLLIKVVRNYSNSDNTTINTNFSSPALAREGAGEGRGALLGGGVTAPLHAGHSHLRRHTYPPTRQVCKGRRGALGVDVRKNIHRPVKYYEFMAYFFLILYSNPILQLEEKRMARVIVSSSVSLLFSRSLISPILLSLFFSSLSSPFNPSSILSSSLSFYLFSLLLSIPHLSCPPLFPSPLFSFQSLISPTLLSFHLFFLSIPHLSCSPLTFHLSSLFF